MKVSNINSQTSFGRVYAVAGSQEQLNELKNRIKNNKGELIVLQSTSLYNDKYCRAYGQCADAVKEGNEIAFFVTGKKDNKKIRYMESGWSSLTGISRHIDRFIQLGDIESTAKKISKDMRK